jgi:hypothetical protein
MLAEAQAAAGTQQVFNHLEAQVVEVVGAEAHLVFHLTLEDKVFLELTVLAEVVAVTVLETQALALTLAAQEL